MSKCSKGIQRTNHILAVHVQCKTIRTPRQNAAITANRYSEHLLEIKLCVRVCVCVCGIMCVGGGGAEKEEMINWNQECLNEYLLVREPLHRDPRSAGGAL